MDDDKILTAPIKVLNIVQEITIEKQRNNPTFAIYFSILGESPDDVRMIKRRAKYVVIHAPVVDARLEAGSITLQGHFNITSDGITYDDDGNEIYEIEI